MQTDGADVWVAGAQTPVMQTGGASREARWPQNRESIVYAGQETPCIGEVKAGRVGRVGKAVRVAHLFGGEGRRIDGTAETHCADAVFGLGGNLAVPIAVGNYTIVVSGYPA